MLTLSHHLLRNLKLSFNEAVEMLLAPTKGRYSFFLKVFIFLTACSLISILSTWYIFDVIDPGAGVLNDIYWENLLLMLLNESPYDILLYALIIPYFMRSNVKQTGVYSFQDYTRSLDIFAYLVYFVGSAFFVLVSMSLWDHFTSDEFTPLSVLEGMLPYSDSFLKELFDLFVKVVCWILLAAFILFQSRDKLTLENLKKSWVRIVSAMIYIYAIAFIASLLLDLASGLIIRPLASFFVEPLIPTLLLVPLLFLFYAQILLIVSTFVQAAFRVEGGEVRQSPMEGLDLLDDHADLRDYSDFSGNDSLD